MRPAVKYWADHAGMEPSIRGALRLAATRAQHLDGAADPQRVDPDSWTLDQHWLDQRSEEHTSELQSLMRISYAVFCLKKKKKKHTKTSRNKQHINIIINYI